MSDTEFICPQCGSEKIESTCMGGNILGSGPDPNRVNCNQCHHKGNAQDWIDIAKFKNKQNDLAISQNVIKVFKDLKDFSIPKDIDHAFDKIKCNLNPGKTIHWYYKEDLEFAKEEDYDIKDSLPYEGIIFPVSESTTAYGTRTELETDDCIVCVVSYPVEKEYCICDWVTLHRLIDNEDLVEIID